VRQSLGRAVVKSSGLLEELPVGPGGRKWPPGWRLPEVAIKVIDRHDGHAFYIECPGRGR